MDKSLHKKSLAPGKKPSSILEQRRNSRVPKATPTSAARPHSTGQRTNSQEAVVISTVSRPSVSNIQRTQSSARQWKYGARPRRGLATEDLAVREQPLDVFRRTAKTVRVISGICLVIKRYAQKGVQMEWETIQSNLKLFAEFDSMMAFSLDTQELSIRPIVGERMQRVLGKRPELRTVKEIQSVQWLLRENDAFQGYPLTTQVELCRCMEYQRYEARRIILRRTHPAEGFYILLSGTVILNIYEKDKPVMKEVHAGGSFGDLELTQDIPRLSTVVCKTDVELMVIFKEDYDRIIKGPQLQQKERHLDYLRSLELFEHFPVEKLLTSPDEFFHKYYKKGKIVVPCANENQHIIIVESGACQILCELSAENRPLSALSIRCSASQSILGEHFPELQEKTRVKDRVKRAKSATLIQWETGEMRNDLRSSVLTGEALADKVLKREDNKRFARITMGHQVKNRKGHPRKYVNIGQLAKGSVFGLESMFTDYPTRLVLLSEGAECIFISRKLFAKESNPNVFEAVSDMLVTYPTEQYLNNKLEEAKQWNQYKRTVISRILQNSGKHNWSG